MNPIFQLNYKILDFFRKTDTLKIYKNIVKKQYASEDELREIQFSALRLLIEHAYKNVPYYTKLFNQISFQPGDLKNIDDIKQLPTTGKDIVRRNFNEIKAANFNSFKPRITQTGGTTGKPFLTYRDKLSHSYMWANIFRAWNAGGFEPGDKFINFAGGSLLPNTSQFKRNIYNFLQNAVLITSYHLTDEKLKNISATISSSGAKYIFGYSSSVYLLSQFCKSNSISLKGKLNAIITTSDMLYKSQREVIEEVFGAKVFDLYGCPEGGLFSFECSRHNGYHLNMESAFVEIAEKNENGLGKIISTPLFNYAFPLIRYETGDVGSYSYDTCQCGRNLDKIKELGGRIRDFIVLRDGRYIHGAFFNHLNVLYNADWIKQYQIIQNDIDDLTIKISKSNEPDEKDLEIIKSEIHKGLLPDLNVNFDFNGVDYTGGGKFRLIISNVSNKWK